MKEYKIYDSCEDLPLNLFIRCIVDNDLSALVIEGTPPIEAIAEAWACIYSQYLDLNEDNEGKYLLNLQTDIVLLRHRTTAVKSVIMILKVMYHEDLVQVLREENFDVELDPEDQNSYHHNLAIIENMLCSDVLQLEMKETELTEYVKSRSGETIDRKYFSRMLVRLSKHMGYQVKSREITVSEFVNMLNDLLSMSTSSSKQEDGDEG